MAGTFPCRPPSARRLRINQRPSRRGMERSLITTSAATFFRMASALSPSAAVVTSAPAWLRIWRSTSRASWSSSTTSTWSPASAPGGVLPADSVEALSAPASWPPNDVSIIAHSLPSTTPRAAIGKTCSSLGPPPSPREEVGERACVEDVGGGQPRAPGHRQSQLEMIELREIVRVGADRDGDAQLGGPARVRLGEIEALGRAVDLDGLAVGTGGREDGFPVGVGGLAGADAPPGRMGEDVDVGMLERAHDPRRHLGAGLLEARVDG